MIDTFVYQIFEVFCKRSPKPDIGARAAYKLDEDESETR